ncbi:Tn3 family transposase [Nonomuraea maritima]|uniref:Tn3 family transposase n=1 Tax=Nonomuraea maritima TaxID=683260 RepID=UPI003CCB7A8F
MFGGGTMSSSDGQRFPVRGKTLTGRTMVIHGGQVLSTYTHVSDQWSTYGTKIMCRRRGRRTMSWTTSWATRPTFRSPSMRPILTAPR